MDSITQVANGVAPRSVTPMAPVSETSQNAPTQDRPALKVARVAQGTPGRAGREALGDSRMVRVDMTNSALWSGDGGVPLALALAQACRWRCRGEEQAR